MDMAAMTEPDATSSARILNSILEDVLVSAAYVESCFVVSRDGLTMAAAGHLSDQDGAGAACAGLLAAGKITAGELRRGALQEAVVQGENGYFVVVQAGSEAFVAIIARREANLGLLFLEARRAGEAVAKVI